jgi:hypothetical protein
MALLDRLGEGKIAFIDQSLIKSMPGIKGGEEWIPVIDRSKMLELGYKPSEIKPILELLPDDLVELENLVDFVDQMGREWKVIDIDTVKNTYVYSVTDQTGISTRVEIPLRKAESHSVQIKILKKDGKAFHSVELEFLDVNAVDQSRWRDAVEKLIQSSTENLVTVMKKVKIQETKTGALGHVKADGNVFEPVIYVNKTEMASQYGLSNELLDQLGGGILKNAALNSDSFARTSPLAMLRHEFGHLLQRNKVGMTPDRIEIWENIVAQDKARSGGQVSKYGSTDLEEDFAETVALYLQNPNSKGAKELYPARFRFLDELYKNDPDLTGKTVRLLREANFQTAKKLGWVTEIESGVFLKMGSAYYYSEALKKPYP